MPKTKIDYSNTIIYKITCKNPAITDVYVGHTTNFVQRKHAHKQNCLNVKLVNCKVYKVIRNNGGWTNWHMEIINFFNCADHYAARKKEQEYFISLNATLNSIEPFPKSKVIKNKINIVSPPSTNPIYLCNNNCITSESGETQNNASNNTIDTSSTLELPPLKFSCEKCHFECSKKGDLNRHLITKKHEYMYSVTTGTEETNIYGNKCVNCLKIYKSRNGLWLHAKKCKKQEPPQITEKLENEIKMLTNLVLEMVKSNADLQKQMLEVCKANNKQIDK